MRILILTPQHRYMEPETQRCITMAARAHGLKIVDPVVGNSSIAAARTDLARRAFKFGFDWVLWWDADNTAAVEQVAALIDDAKADVAEVIGTNYWTRDGKLPSWKPLETAKFNMGTTGQIYQRCKVGFGFTMVGRRAFELVETLPNLPTLPFADEPTKTGPHWFKELPDNQEDFSFCLRVLEAGGRSAVDTRICPGHINAEPVYWYSNWLKEQAPKSGMVPLNVDVD